MALPEGLLVPLEADAMRAWYRRSPHNLLVYLMTGRKGVPRQAGSSREERRRLAGSSSADCP